MFLRRYRRLYVGLPMLMLALLVGVHSSAAQTAPAPITSNFDADTEGWTTRFINNQANPPVPVWQETGGNPGGYIQGQDTQNGPQWYWVAPAKFYGDRSAAYGNELTFDLTTTDIRNPIREIPSVIMSGGGLTIEYPTSVLPTQQWTTIRIRLDETAGWTTRSSGGTPGTPVTADQMRAVLASLTSLQLRAEYNFGPDINSLDNVVFGAPTEEISYLPIVQR